jgi:hypothetical protein
LRSVLIVRRTPAQSTSPGLATSPKEFHIPEILYNDLIAPHQGTLGEFNAESSREMRTAPKITHVPTNEQTPLTREKEKKL